MLTALQNEDDNKRLDVIRRWWSVKLIHPWPKSVTEKRAAVTNLGHSHLPMILGLTVIHTVCAFPGPYVPKMYMIHNEHMTRGSYVPSSVVKNIVVLMHNDSEYLKGLMRCAATGLGWNGNGRSVVWILYIWGKWTGKDKRIQTCPICKCRYTLVLTKGANVTQIRHLKDQL